MTDLPHGQVPCWTREPTAIPCPQGLVEPKAGWRQAAGLLGIPCAVTQARVTVLRGSGLPVAGVGLWKSSGDSHTPSLWKTAIMGLRSPWKPSVTIRQQR